MTERAVTVTFAGSGDAFGSGGRYQACIHVRPRGQAPFLVDCGSTSLTALKAAGLDPGEIGTVLVSHLHGDHFGGLPYLVLDGQFRGRTRPLTVAGPPGTAARLRQAMEVLFPGSADVARRFRVEVTELVPGGRTTVGGIGVASFEVIHPSGPHRWRCGSPWAARSSPTPGTPPGPMRCRPSRTGPACSSPRRTTSARRSRTT